MFGVPLTQFAEHLAARQTAAARRAAAGLPGRISHNHPAAGLPGRISRSRRLLLATPQIPSRPLPCRPVQSLALLVLLHGAFHVW